MLKNTLKYFREISKIPRCSFHEERVLSYLINFAEKNKYNFKLDTIWNIIIYVPASSWREKDNTLILQWHIDMVCVKSENSKHNFDKESIEIIEEAWWIKANNTTLWADNGIWVAMILASTLTKTHPKLELLFTVKEEVWLIWAIELEEKYLSWKYLINLDSEEEKEIIISSSWWARLEIEWTYKEIEWTRKKYQINISGMKWWHSGIEINQNRWNSIYEFISFLNQYNENIEIYKINWWIADNVIPSSISAILWIKDMFSFEKKLNIYIENIKKNIDAPEIKYKIEKIINNQNKCIDLSIKQKLFNNIIKNKPWIISISKNIDALVETSINLWKLIIEKWKVKITYLPRSSKTNELKKVINNLEESYSHINLKTTISNKYPWWEENKNWYLVTTVKSIYDKVNNYDNKLTAIHAWLECWAIVEKIWWNIQAVSIWPNIRWAHSTKEKCEIRSISVIAEVLENILKEIK